MTVCTLQYNDRKTKKIHVSLCPLVVWGHWPSVQSMQHYLQVALQYFLHVFTVIRLTVPLGEDHCYPRPSHIILKWKSDIWTLFHIYHIIHHIFHLSLVTVNVGCFTIIRTHNEDVECNDSVRAVTDFIDRLSKIIQSTFPGGEDDPDELTGEGVCVCAETALCPVNVYEYMPTILLQLLLLLVFCFLFSSSFFFFFLRIIAIICFWFVSVFLCYKFLRFILYHFIYIRMFTSVTCTAPKKYI